MSAELEAMQRRILRLEGAVAAFDLSLKTIIRASSLEGRLDEEIILKCIFSLKESAIISLENVSGDEREIMTGLVDALQNLSQIDVNTDPGKPSFIVINGGKSAPKV